LAPHFTGGGDGFGCSPTSTKQANLLDPNPFIGVKKTSSRGRRVCAQGRVIGRGCEVKRERGVDGGGRKTGREYMIDLKIKKKKTEEEKRKSKLTSTVN